MKMSTLLTATALAVAGTVASAEENFGKINGITYLSGCEDIQEAHIQCRGFETPTIINEQTTANNTSLDEVLILNEGLEDFIQNGKVREWVFFRVS